LAELSFYFALDETLDDGDGVKGRVDVDILERVGFEDDCDALLLRDYEDDVGGELEMGKAEKHRDYQGLFGSEHSCRPRQLVDIWQFVIQWICLQIVYYNGEQLGGYGTRT
jgi:hypothetical protein